MEAAMKKATEKEAAMNRQRKWTTVLVAAGWIGLALFAPRAEASVVHVATNGLHLAPYANWENAATNIQTAVDYAATNGILVVQLTNHTYVIPGQIFVTNAVTVRGSSRTNTVVRRATTDDSGTKHRIFRLNHAGAVVESLRMQYGHADNTGSGTLNRGGGADVILGTVRDCEIANCRGSGTTALGMGIYLHGAGAMASNCVIYASVGNSGALGGGAYVGPGALLTHSTLRDYVVGGTARGAGAYVNGGTLRWCNVYGNDACLNLGVGIYMADNAAGLVEYCTVTNNMNSRTEYWANGAIGIHMAGAGTVRNCLVAYNSGRLQGCTGAGLYLSAGSLAENCTVVNNYAATDAGGVYVLAGGTVRNCIIAGNMSGGTSQNARTNAGTFVTCLLPGGAPGTGNIDGTPIFMDAAARDFRLAVHSKGLNAGTDQSWMTGAVDLAGDPRIQLGHSDIGAYETPSTFACAYTVNPQLGFAPLTAVFTATVVGDNTNGLTYFWDFDGNGSWDDSGTDKRTTSHPYALGVYTPVLWVTNELGHSATYTGRTAIVASTPTLYVATNGTHAVPFDTWAKAATNIQSAVDAAADGARIVVSNGTYTLGAQIVVDKAITVESVNGAAVTTLRCATSRTHRVLKLNNVSAVVRGLTLDNGYPYEFENGVVEVWRGGGAYVRAGTLVDCTVTNCSSATTAASKNMQGIGIYLAGAGALASNCVVTSSFGAYSPRGGGAYVDAGALMTHCTLRNYSGDAYGGAIGAGAYVNGGTLRWCNVYSNACSNAGGVGIYMADNAAGLVEYCTVTNNMNTTIYDASGIGIFMAGAGTVRNCLVGFNTGSGGTCNGGGLYLSAGSLAENCTVVSNYAATDGGGVYVLAGGTNRNCIFVGNTSGGTSQNARTNTGTFVTCLLPGGAPGPGNIDGSPTFMDAAARDYRLAPTSLGVNAGTYQAWMDSPAVDLAGEPRILNKAVDMGAYETYVPPRGTVILIR